MGLSCNSEKSLEEVIGSLRFVSQDSEERESVGITVDEERREDDIDVERVNHDIIVDSDR